MLTLEYRRQLSSFWTVLTSIPGTFLDTSSDEKNKKDVKDIPYRSILAFRPSQAAAFVVWLVHGSWPLN